MTPIFSESESVVLEQSRLISISEKPAESNTQSHVYILKI